LTDVSIYKGQIFLYNETYFEKSVIMRELLKITEKRIKNHLHYGKWYYIVAIIAVLVLVNLAYTITEPNYPKESTVVIMMYAGNADEEVIETWESEMLQLLPDDQREVELISTPPIDTTTQTVVVARIAAAEDDVLIVNSEDIAVYADQGAFLPLDEHMDLDKIFRMYPDVDWSQYKQRSESLDDKEEHIYWLPLNMVKGFEDLGLKGDNLGIGILSNSVNADNAALCIDYIITK